MRRISSMLCLVARASRPRDSLRTVPSIRRPPPAVLAFFLALLPANHAFAEERPDLEPSPSTVAVDRTRARYELQGIEIRGNERTRDRVILRYLPFRPGDLLDVDDPEIELARYRLLGTGF